MINRLKHKHKLGKLHRSWILQTLLELQKHNSKWKEDDLKKLRQLFAKTYDIENLLLRPKDFPEVSDTCKRKLLYLFKEELVWL